MPKNRAFSFITVKAVDEEQRIITGIATTPTPDRVGDIVEPLGVKYKNPLPLLWQHRSDQPVGTVRFDKPTKDGITFTARLPRIDEPGPLKDRVDTAWGEVKHGLVRAVSIGFKDIEFSRMEGGGYRFIESEVLELSLVTIPANQDATIQTVKSIDDQLIAKSRDERVDTKPGVTGRTVKTIVTSRGDDKPGRKEASNTMKKKIPEQIAQYTRTREAKTKRMLELMEASSESGETLTAEAQTEYDELEADIKSIDAHVTRLKTMESLALATASPVDGDGEDAGTRSRAAAGGEGGDNGTRKSVRVTGMKSNLPAGIAFTRFALALARAKGNRQEALEVFKAVPEWKDQTPEVETVLKAAVAAGTTTDTTWAAPLVEYNVMTSEFIEFLRPMTIIGRIPGLRRVPFKIKVPRQTAVASVGWVGENKPKPVSKSAFDSITFDHFKIAGIIALTEELVRLSNPSAEMLARNDLADGIVELMDNDFIDPDKAAVANTSPASITYGVTPVAATGTAYSHLKADVKSVFQKFADARLSPAGIVILTTPMMALSLSLMETSLGQPQFPNLTMAGGSMFGLPVVVSDNIPYTEDSPQEGTPIIFIKASDIMLADDGQVVIDVSREASIQMNDAPDSPASASTVLVSLWQHNLVGIRAERMVNWAKRRDAAVQMISAAKYV